MDRFRNETIRTRMGMKKDLLTCWFPAELISSTLKMEAICSSETSVDTQRTTRRNMPEDDTLQKPTLLGFNLRTKTGSTLGNVSNKKQDDG
jgi:hypothetical protein